MARPRKQTTQALAKKNKVDFKSESMTESLQAILDLPSMPPTVTALLQHLNIKKKPKNLRDAINMVAVAQALNGSFSHYKEIFDRIDGRPISSIEENEDEVSLIFKVKKQTARVEKRKQAVRKRLDEQDQGQTIEIKANVEPAKKRGRPKGTTKTTKTKRNLEAKK